MLMVCNSGERMLGWGRTKREDMNGYLRGQDWTRILIIWLAGCYKFRSAPYILALEPAKSFSLRLHPCQEALQTIVCSIGIILTTFYSYVLIKVYFCIQSMVLFTATLYIQKWKHQIFSNNLISTKFQTHISRFKKLHGNGLSQNFWFCGHLVDLSIHI